MQIFPHSKFGIDRTAGLKVMAKKFLHSKLYFLAITFEAAVRLIPNFEYTLDTFTKGDPDIGPHLFKAFRPSIIGPIYNRVMKIELEIGGVTI